MERDLASNLESHLGMLLSGGLSPKDFRSWFARALWSAEGSADEDTLDFALLIENRTAMLSSSHISENAWLDALRRDYAERYPPARRARPNEFLITFGSAPAVNVLSRARTAKVNAPPLDILVAPGPVSRVLATVH